MLVKVEVRNPPMFIPVGCQEMPMFGHFSLHPSSTSMLKIQESRPLDELYSNGKYSSALALSSGLVCQQAHA